MAWIQCMIEIPSNAPNKYNITIEKKGRYNSENRKATLIMSFL